MYLAYLNYQVADGFRSFPSLVVEPPYRANWYIVSPES